MPARVKRAAIYAWTVLKRAWTDSIAFVGWGWRTVVLLILPGIVAFSYLMLFPTSQGFADFLRSGFFGLVVSATAFAVIFVVSLLLAPSQVDHELRQELSAHVERLRNRADHDEIAKAIQERYEVGYAIGQRGTRLDWVQHLIAQRWHRDNLRIFTDLLPEHELFMYRTHAPDPPIKRKKGLMPPHNMTYHELHDARLAKLRLIIARILEGKAAL